MNAIGPFTLERILGQGGMATVYLAQHPELGRIALRVILKDSTRNQQDVINGERTGAMLHRLLSAKSCPGVPRAYEPYEDEHYLCIPVEFVAGETLAHRLDRGTFAEAEALRIGLAVCDNLEFAHAFKAHDGRNIDHVVHGDIKPANLMLDPRGNVWVLDYGISKPIREDQRTRNVFGAACYSSPERLLHKSFDHHIDLWALGVILYEMISGRRPYEGNEAEVRAAMQAGRTPAPLREASPAFQAVVQKMLMRDISRRYPSAAEVRADLERLNRQEVPLAQSTPPPVHDDHRTVRAPAGISTTAAAHTAAAGTATERAAHAPYAPPNPPLDMARKVAAIVLALCLTIAVYKTWKEFGVMRDAGKFAQELRSRNTISAADWTAYQALQERSLFGLGLGEPRRILQERFKEEAGRAIKDYRDGFDRALAGARRQSAELALQRALSLNDNDRQTRAMLHVVQAYGTAWENEQAARDAVSTLEKAAALWPSSPDPHLGIARIVAYKLTDPVRVEQELHEAERVGYRRQPRDTAMLADARRARALALLRPLRKRSCGDFNRDLLDRITGLLTASIDEYLAIPDFKDQPTNLESARRLLDEVRQLCPVEPAPAAAQG